MCGGTHQNLGPQKSSSSYARGVLPTSPLCRPAKHWAFLFSPCRVSPFKFFIRRRYVKARCLCRLASKVFGNAQPQGQCLLQVQCRLTLMSSENFLSLIQQVSNLIIKQAEEASNRASSKQAIKQSSKEADSCSTTWDSSPPAFQLVSSFLQFPVSFKFWDSSPPAFQLVSSDSLLPRHTNATDSAYSTYFQIMLFSSST